LGEHTIHSILDMFLLLMEYSFPNSEYSHDVNEFPQLFGQTTFNQYCLAIHVLENNNMFTIREVEEMINKPNEEYVE
jgi:hypothetical protein